MSRTYHEQSPESVVEEDDCGSQKHGDAYEFVELRPRETHVLAILLLRCANIYLDKLTIVVNSYE